MSTSQSERTDGRDYDSYDDEKEIMEKNWKKNISEIEKVSIKKICFACSIRLNRLEIQLDFLYYR